MSEIDRIKQIVCSGEGLPIEMIALKSKSRELVFARQCIIYLARCYTKLTLKQIASEMGLCYANIYQAEKKIIGNLCVDRRIEKRIYSHEIQVVNALGLSYKTVERDHLKTKIMSQIAENRVISSDLVDRYNELTKTN